VSAGNYRNTETRHPRPKPGTQGPVIRFRDRVRGRIARGTSDAALIQRRFCRRESPCSIHDCSVGVLSSGSFQHRNRYLRVSDNAANQRIRGAGSDAGSVRPSHLEPPSRGSGRHVMHGQTFNSVGDRNSAISKLLSAYYADNVPSSNDDNWGEQQSGINGHTISTCVARPGRQPSPGVWISTSVTTRKAAPAIRRNATRRFPSRRSPKTGTRQTS